MVDYLWHNRSYCWKTYIEIFKKMKKSINTSYYKLCIYEYIRLSHLTQKQYEIFLHKNVTDSGFADFCDVVKFMRKEIFPLKRETIKWCLHYFDRNSDDIYYVTILKKLKLPKKL